MREGELGFLILESGQYFDGQFLGGTEKAGEVVFNTSHSGYEEMATDPSYFNQILVMTAPQQGNYGADDVVWESKRIYIQALICSEMDSGTRDVFSWREKLISYGVPILSGVDTRALVLHIRKSGPQWGAILASGQDGPPHFKELQKKARYFISSLRKMERDWPFLVSEKKVRTIKGDKAGGPVVGVLDLGCKKSIVEELKCKCKKIVVFPARTHPQDILKHKVKALIVSNGPGNPAHSKVSIQVVRSLLSKLPIMGICLGHQILALAMGAKTYQLPFGHRGSNHPVKDKLNKKIYVTSQNHGYAVKADSLPPHTALTHINLNDGTLEGFVSETMKCMGIQFHPESHPGPREAGLLFDNFLNRVKSS